MCRYFLIWVCLLIVLKLGTGFRFRGYTSTRTLATTTSSLSSLGVAYSWYLSCRAMHKSCRRLVSSTRWCPTRLLDIGVPGDLTWKLHICAEERMTSPNYMTLSYRWGDLPSLKLMQSNINELRQGKFVDELPQTFRDAVTVLHRFSSDTSGLTVSASCRTHLRTGKGSRQPCMTCMRILPATSLP